MPHPKIKSLKELVVIVKEFQKQGKKVVQCHGTFDLVHPGHIEHFRDAKSQGDVLVVSVTADRLVRKGPGRPIFPQDLRLKGIAALEDVDYVLLDEFGEGPALIRLLQPNIFAKGPDYAGALQISGSPTDLERRTVETAGGRMYITGSKVISSSTELINRHFNPFSEELADFLNVFKKRHSYGELDRWLKAISDKRILVVGDAIIDEYHYCKPLGMSAKENLISVNYEKEESFAGGAVATANHLSGFCKEVALFSGLGKERSREDFIRERLKSNVEARFVYRDDGPTVVIRRYIEPVFFKKYFQLYFHNPAVPEELDAKIAVELEPLLAKYDIILVNDFGLGFLGPRTIKLICARARFLAVNTQTNSSNRGFNFITKYPRADYGCIDHLEIRLAAQSRYEPMEELIRQASVKLNAARFAVTLGHQGSMTHDRSLKEFYTIPVLSQNVIDRVGAGDAYFAITAPLVALKAPMDLVGFIGNTMGAIAVTMVGNERSISRPELTKWMSALLK